MFLLLLAPLVYRFLSMELALGEFLGLIDFTGISLWNFDIWLFNFCGFQNQ
jgi:hypothetical protein